MFLRSQKPPPLPEKDIFFINSNTTNNNNGQNTPNQPYSTLYSNWAASSSAVFPSTSATPSSADPGSSTAPMTAPPPPPRAESSLDMYRTTAVSPSPSGKQRSGLTGHVSSIRKAFSKLPSIGRRPSTSGQSSSAVSPTSSVAQDLSDSGITTPWNVQHTVHVEPVEGGLVGLPTAWSSALAERGFSEEEIRALYAKQRTPNAEPVRLNSPPLVQSPDLLSPYPPQQALSRPAPSLPPIQIDDLPATQPAPASAPPNPTTSTTQPQADPDYNMVTPKPRSSSLRRKQNYSPPLSREGSIGGAISSTWRRVKSPNADGPNSITSPIQTSSPGGGERGPLRVINDVNDTPISPPPRFSTVVSQPSFSSFSTDKSTAYSDIKSSEPSHSQEDELEDEDEDVLDLTSPLSPPIRTPALPPRLSLHKSRDDDGDDDWSKSLLSAIEIPSGSFDLSQSTFKSRSPGLSPLSSGFSSAANQNASLSSYTSKPSSSSKKSEPELDLDPLALDIDYSSLSFADTSLLPHDSISFSLSEFPIPPQASSSQPLLKAALARSSPMSDRPELPNPHLPSTQQQQSRQPSQSTLHIRTESFGTTASRPTSDSPDVPIIQIIRGAEVATRTPAKTTVLTPVTPGRREPPSPNIVLKSPAPPDRSSTLSTMTAMPSPGRLGDSLGPPSIDVFGVSEVSTPAPPYSLLKSPNQERLSEEQQEEEEEEEDQTMQYGRRHTLTLDPLTQHTSPSPTAAEEQEEEATESLLDDYLNDEDEEEEDTPTSSNSPHRTDSAEGSAESTDVTSGYVLSNSNSGEMSSAPHSAVTPVPPYAIPPPPKQTQSRKGTQEASPIQDNGDMPLALRPLAPYIHLADPHDRFQDLVQVAEGQYGPVYSASIKVAPPPVSYVKSKYARSPSPVSPGARTIVAVKTISISHTAKLSALYTEFSVVANNVRHQHVLSNEALYLHEATATLWVEMELMERSLADLLALMDEGLIITETGVARFASDVLQGLTYLQTQGIAHRDVRSDNLLLSRDGLLKLADFSNAVKLSSSNDKRSTILPVPLYWMAPEIRSGQPYSAYKADIWSVGAVVWELIEGQPPFAEVEDPSELRDRWPEFSDEDAGSIALHQFLRLCSEPQQTRPAAKELLNTPFILSACQRSGILRILGKAREMEEYLVES